MGSIRNSLLYTSNHQAKYCLKPLQKLAHKLALLAIIQSNNTNIFNSRNFQFFFQDNWKLRMDDNIQDQASNFEVEDEKEKVVAKLRQQLQKGAALDKG